jgi:hypothetical protein
MVSCGAVAGGSGAWPAVARVCRWALGRREEEKAGKISGENGGKSFMAIFEDIWRVEKMARRDGSEGSAAGEIL